MKEDPVVPPVYFIAENSLDMEDKALLQCLFQVLLCPSVRWKIVILVKYFIHMSHAIILIISR